MKTQGFSSEIIITLRFKVLINYVNVMCRILDYNNGKCHIN